MRKETSDILNMISEYAISIHSFHAEGDIVFKFYSCLIAISIHSFHAEGDELT